MSDDHLDHLDHLDEQLRSYADHVQRDGRLPASSEIRRRAHRRKQQKLVAATFGVVLVGGLGLGLGLGIDRSAPPVNPVAPPTATPSAPAPSSPTTSAPETSTPETSTPETSAPESSTPTSPVRKRTSDVSQLTSLGITLGAGVLIDAADDGVDRYLAIDENGRVDFTGTGKTDNTMMALKAAKVVKRTEATKNQVVIAPPFYNEDLGAGSCVADTAPGELSLATCDDQAADQIWTVVPAGDSGQFELHGEHTDIRVDNGRIVTGTTGYVGLQTLPFAE